MPDPDTRSAGRPRAALECGAFFLGEWSPEVAGDYVAGSSHVLPTGGTARFASGLSVQSFLRTRVAIEYDREMLALGAKAIQALAAAEGLGAHARSIAVRFEEDRRP